jgi:hypothetical protein
MKIYFFIIVFLSSFSAFAQNPYYDSTKQLQIIKTQGSINKNLIILGQLKPAIDTFKMAVQDSGSIASKNNNLYLWNGYSWKLLNSSGGTGSNVIANYGLQKNGDTLRVDTLLLKTVLDAKGDSLALASQTNAVNAQVTANTAAIPQRVRYTDTAAMLFPYALKSKTQSDSSFLKSLINTNTTNIGLKVNINDTASMLLPYTRVTKTRSDSTVQRQALTDSAAAIRAASAISGAWSLTGNSGTDSSINFIGTTDSKPLIFRISNIKSGVIDSSKANSSLGFGSLRSVTTGNGNAAIGYNALKNVTTGQSNNAFGSGALQTISTASSNTAFGNGALRDLQSGSQNLAVGLGAMLLSQTTSNNVAIGTFALGNAVTVASENIAIGNNCAINLTTGQFNLAIGNNVMQQAVSGNYNNALGNSSMTSLTSGSQNSGYGNSSLNSLTSGSNNTAIGRSLQNTTSGSNNIGIGWTSGLYNTTENNQLYVSSLFFADLPTSKTSSIIYGVQNATTSAQFLTVNGMLGVNTITPQGALDISSTTTGFLAPRMTTTQRNAIPAPADGSQVYDITIHNMCFYSTAIPGWRQVTNTAAP